MYKAYRHQQLPTAAGLSDSYSETSQMHFQWQTGWAGQSPCIQSNTSCLTEAAPSQVAPGTGSHLDLQLLAQLLVLLVAVELGELDLRPGSGAPKTDKGCSVMNAHAMHTGADALPSLQDKIADAQPRPALGCARVRSSCVGSGSKHGSSQRCSARRTWGMAAAMAHSSG